MVLFQESIPEVSAVHDEYVRRHEDTSGTLLARENRTRLWENVTRDLSPHTSSHLL